MVALQHTNSRTPDGEVHTSGSDTAGTRSFGERGPWAGRIRAVGARSSAVAP